MSTLYIIATPIGHLQDITLRALETLRQVNVIAAEDTRHSQILLQHYAIHKPLIAYHEHNAETVMPRLLALLQNGQSLALISDAGTPLISDPGYELVNAVRAAQIPIVPIPGACAAIAALSVAGLPSDRFVFEGFLPAKNKARLQRLQQLADETRTLIFYEAPHRLQATISDMVTAFGANRLVCLAKELTKRFEMIQQTTLQALSDVLRATPETVRGEYVVLVAGLPAAQAQAAQQAHALPLLRQLLSCLPLKKAVKITADLTGTPKNALYTQALQWQTTTDEEKHDAKT